MIPKFNKDGYLPTGIHKATVKEIRQRFGSETPKREELFGKFKNLIQDQLNQFDKIDHIHLGQALTYMAYHDAKTMVLICEESRYEHEKVITWLNENTLDEGMMTSADKKLMKQPY